MSGRGRARPPSRSAQEPAAGASRRSTRQQQQQHNTAPAGEEQPPSSAEEDHQEQQKSPDQQEQLEQAHNPSLQPEAPMSAPMYHQDIDPAITGSQDTGMPPPPVPGSKGSRGHTELGVPRRGMRRGASSVVSINSHPVTDALSSQPEPQNTGLPRAASARLFGTPGPAPSVVSSTIDDTPSRRAAREQLMGVMLSRLFFATDDYFNHTRSEQTDPEMWEAEQEAFKEAFDTYRRHYVADDTAPFVDFTFVADTMRLDKKPALWHKVFKVVSAANFAILFDEITLVKQQDLLPRLQAWHSAFPGLFIAEGSDTTAYARSEQVIEQALLIRMQLSIATLEVLKRDSRVPFNPVEEIAKIWCEGDVSLESIEAFLGNNDDAIQLKPVAPTSFEAAALDRDRNANRFRSICVLLPKHSIEGHDLDLSQLQDTYPLKEFLETLRSFVAVWFGNIKASLQHDLTHSDATSRAESQIRFQLETDAMAPGFDRSESSTQMEVFDSTGLRMLKQQLQGSPTFGDSQQLSQSSYPPAPRIPYPPGFSSPSPALGYADSMQQGGLQSNGSMYAESAAQVSGRKRGVQDDPSMAAESTAPPAKKTRTRRKKKDLPQAAMDPASTAITASQSQYPPLPGTQDEPDFDALSQRTREITAAARKVKEPQVRSSWVSRDVKLLVKAVNTYQCKWSTIEKEIKAGTIPFERPRDQQALRDKARLLKQDFLKADMVLPRGFDLVVLGKKEREAVKAVGRNPDRKEADIDENGQPINTQYAGEGAAPAVLPAPLHSVNPQPEQQLQQLQSQPEQQSQHQPEHQSGHQSEHQPEHQPEQAEPQPAAPEQVVA